MTKDFSVRGMFGWYPWVEYVKVIGESTSNYRNIVESTVNEIKDLLTEKGLKLKEENETEEI